MKRTTLSITGAVLGLMAIGGCSHEQPATATSTTASTPTTNPTQTALDNALHSYYLARQTLAAMEENPKKTLAEYPASLKITNYLADPLLTETVKNGAELAAGGWSFKTQMALSTPKTVSVNLAKKTIVLRHCNSDEKVTAYSHGEEVDTTPEPGTVPGPHRVTFTMVQVGPQWKLSQIVSDGKTTCHTD